MQRFNDNIANARSKAHLHISHKPHQHVEVVSLDGKKHNLKAAQSVMTHNNTINSFVNPLGSFASPWGGNIDIEIKNSWTHGNIREVYLDMQINNATGGQVESVPSDLYFDYHEWLTSSGQRIAQYYPENLSDGKDYYNEEEYRYHARLIGRDEDYNTYDNVWANGETKRRYLRLINNVFEQNEFFIPSLGEILTLRLWFKPWSSVGISGNPLTFTNMRLMAVSDYLVDFNYNHQLQLARNNVLTFNYNYPLIQRFTQPFSAGNYQFTLTGFNAMVTTLYFKLIPPSATGRNLDVSYFINSFEILAEDGTNIMGSTVRTDLEDEIAYKGNYSNFFRDAKYIYRYNHCKDPLAFRSHGVITGYHFYNTREILEINLSVETQRVLTYTGTTPTAGSYRFRYGKYTTAVLAFNANAAAIQTAINALEPFKDNNVVASGVLDNNMTITYGGITAHKQKELLIVESLNLDSAFDVAETTAYVPGIPTAGVNYQLVIWADTVSKFDLENGTLHPKQN